VARYATTIDSRLAPADAFAYMANFVNAQEWDPSVVEARRLDDGELRVGSAFHVISKFAGRKVPLRYEITALDADRKVVLEAWSGIFGSVDTISVVASAGGSRVTYDARLVFKGLARLADPLMQLVFNRVGRKADASLRTQLNRVR
jgi:Polyketide cyclase / dehydrase and lipid transport